MKIRILSCCLLLLAIAPKTFAQEKQAGRKPLPDTSANGGNRYGIPSNWTAETISLPPKFAPTIPIQGTETIWFSPGWGKDHAPDYWTYCFLWTLKNGPVTNDGQETKRGQETKPPNNHLIRKEELEKYLADYYTGLIKSNLSATNEHAQTGMPVTVNLQADKKNGRDVQDFEGHVRMIDYMTQKPLELFLRVHVKRQKLRSQQTLVFIEASPQSFNNMVIWRPFDNISNKIR